MVEFLHGVETFNLTKGPRPVTEVKSSVIGLAGTAPIHHVTDPAEPDELTLFLSDRNLPEYGPSELAGYTIPKALEAIVNQEGGTAFVVNVFDPTVHKTTVAEALKPITSGKATLEPDLISVVVKKLGTATLATITTDYTVVLATGVITIVAEGLLDGETRALVSFTDSEGHPVEAIYPITTGTITLGETNVTAVVVSKLGADTLCVAGTDYTVDRIKGIVTVVAGGLLAAATKCVAGYDKPNLAHADLVDGTAIIGTVDAGGQRSGMQAWLNAGAEFGYGPKILIAPGYSSLPTVRAAGDVLAQKTKLRARFIADVPVGATVSEVLAGRGDDEDVDLTLASDRVDYVYPHLKVSATELEPYSPYLAGQMAANDRENGYWHSPSNRPIKGVIGLELPLTAAVNDTQCDVNQLNGAGIVTVFSGYGQPLSTWGNRSSIYPSNGDITSFIAVHRTIDMVEETLELYSKRFNDKPITSALVEAVLEDTNAFVRLLIGRGALMPDSRVEYFAEDNPPEELAAGHITFTRTYCPPPPAERITFKAVLDTTLLKVG